MIMMFHLYLRNYWQLVVNGWNSEFQECSSWEASYPHVDVSTDIFIQSVLTDLFGLKKWEKRKDEDVRCSGRAEEELEGKYQVIQHLPLSIEYS